MAVGGRDFYHNNTLITGSLYKLLDAQQTGTPATTSTNHGSGGSVVRQIVPYTTGTGGATAIPAVGAAPTGRGWRVDLADMGAGATFTRSIAAGIWQMVVSVTQSDVLVASGTVTVILYKVTGSGATAATEIGRGSVSAPRSGADVTVNITPSGGGGNVPAQTFTTANESFQIEVYITASGGTLGNVATFRTTGVSRLISPEVIKTISTETGGAAHDRSGGSTSQAAPMLSYRNEVMSDLPLMYWRLNESSGTVQDESGNGRTGTVSGTVTRNQGGLFAGTGSSYDFAGGFINTTYTPVAAAGDVRTFECIFNLDTAEGALKVVWGSNSVTGYALWFPGGGSMNLGFSSGGINSVAWTEAEHGMVAGNSYHIVVTVDPANTASGVTLWVDGVNKGSRTSGNWTNFAAFQLAAKDSSQTFDGRMDEVAIYAGILSPARIAAHYDARIRAADTTAQILSYDNEVMEDSPGLFAKTNEPALRMRPNADINGFSSVNDGNNWVPHAPAGTATGDGVGWSRVDDPVVYPDDPGDTDVVAHNGAQSVVAHLDLTTVNVSGLTVTGLMAFGNKRDFGGTAGATEFRLRLANGTELAAVSDAANHTGRRWTAVPHEATRTQAELDGLRYAITGTNTFNWQYVTALYVDVHTASVDSSGSGRTLTRAQVPQGYAGPTAGAALAWLFPQNPAGTAGLVPRVDTNYPITAGQRYTLEGFFYRMSDSGFNTLFAGNNSAIGNNAFALGFEPAANGNNLQLWYSGGNVGATWTPAQHGMVLNTWYHVVLTWDMTTDIAELFVDGISKGSRTVPGDTATTNLKIGATTTDSASPWHGYISKVSVYPAILSPSRIQAHYDARDRAVNQSLGYGKQILVRKASGAMTAGVGGGPKKVEYADTGGAVTPRVGGASKKVEYADTGGSTSPRSGGGSKKIEYADTGGSTSPRVGGGVRKAELVKAGGSTSVFVGGGSKKVEYADTGGAASLRSGGGSKVIQKVAVGGGVLVGRGGGPKVASLTKTGGGQGIFVGGGTKALSLTKAGGARAILMGGGPRVVTVARTGGARSILSGGGPKVAIVSRVGGGILRGANGGSQTVMLIKAGGAVLLGVGGGGADTHIVKLGGASVSFTGGGLGRPDVAKVGGASITGAGGAVQYSVYTFGIGDYTKDGFGNIVVAAKVSLVAVNFDGSYEVMAMGMSDPVTGYYAFVTPSPLSDPRTYFTTAFRRFTGDPEPPSIFGRTNENLTPEATLVQGSE